MDQKRVIPYLSPWFSWHLERSYPQGKSDPFGKLRASLEFVGKYNEKFANLRWVIEFKYYSNSEFAKFKTPIETFQLQPEDTEQINGYAEGLQQEFPTRPHRTLCPLLHRQPGVSRLSG